MERTSLARGALPVLPPFLAWICLLLNSLVPGTGTILSGLLGMCLGAPRFSPQVTAEHRFLALVINLVVGISQVVTVLFCLVGWCWSLGWGIILVKTAGISLSWFPYLRTRATLTGEIRDLQTFPFELANRIESVCNSLPL